MAEKLKKAITATGTAQNKTYDGNTSATGSLVVNGKVDGDDLGATGVFTFSDKNAGTGKTVNVSGLELTGDDRNNYTVTLSGPVLADILKRLLIVTADNKSRAVNDKSDPALTYTVGGHGLVAGESLTGALTRTDGKAPGLYRILQGSLASSTNYELRYFEGTFTITLPSEAGKGDGKSRD